tara:strand:- start:60 stop:236 length:177 start_codon:yes stop_codon:yes gene_type:complete
VKGKPAMKIGCKKEITPQAFRLGRTLKEVGEITLSGQSVLGQKMKFSLKAFRTPIIVW